MAEAYRPPAYSFDPKPYIEFYKLVGGDEPDAPPLPSDLLPVAADQSIVDEAERILRDADPNYQTSEERVSESAFDSFSTLIKQKASENPSFDPSDKKASILDFGEVYPGVQVVSTWSNPDGESSLAADTGMIGSLHFIAKGEHGGPDVLSYWLFDTPDGKDIERSYRSYESWTDILLLTEPAAVQAENGLYGINIEGLPPVSDPEVFSAIDIVSEYANAVGTYDFGGADMGQLAGGYAGYGDESGASYAGESGGAGDGGGADGGGDGGDD